MALVCFLSDSWDDLRFHEIFLFEIGIYYGNVTENGTAGMMVMTMTAVDYDDAEEGNWLFQILKSPKIGKKRALFDTFLTSFRYQCQTQIFY